MKTPCAGCGYYIGSCFVMQIEMGTSEDVPILGTRPLYVDEAGFPMKKDQTRKQTTRTRQATTDTHTEDATVQPLKRKRPRTRIPNIPTRGIQDGLPYSSLLSQAHTMPNAVPPRPIMNAIAGMLSQTDKKAPAAPASQCRLARSIRISPPPLSCCGT